MDLAGALSTPLARVLGVVVSMKKLARKEDSFYFIHPDGDDSMLMELDDGTGCIPCWIPAVIMERTVDLNVGKTVDCTGELQHNGKWIKANTLLEVHITAAERLRWMEIAERENIAQCGYPCLKASSEEMLEIIESAEDDGVAIADLALVVGLPLEQVQPLIQDLQLRGLIYQNVAGSFVPL